LSGDPARPRNRLALAALGLVVAWGCYIRLADLGRNTMATDEMNHYFVGQALERHEGPVLPSGAEYTRGLEYSKLVAATLPRVDNEEVAVRLPAALFGVASLILFAAVSWALGGPWAAVLATLLLAIYPEGVRLSRFGRFYAMQLLAGLIAMYAGWRLVRDPLEVNETSRGRLWRDWGWAALAAVAFAYAARVQVTTLSVVAGFACFVALVGIRDLVRLKGAAWKRSVPWQLTVAGVVGVVVMAIVRNGVLEDLLWRARAVPMWARMSTEGNASVTAYYRAFSAQFPLVISLLPLVFIVAIVRRPRTGWFLTAWFGIPLALHSLFLEWRSERFVLLAVPGLLIAAGIAGAAGAEALAGYLARRTGRPLLAGLITAGIVLAAVVTQPAFNAARRQHSGRVSNGWLESRRLMAADSSLGKLPLGSAMPLAALHYWGRLDFTIQPALLETWTRDPESHDPDRPYRFNPMGSPDVYSGRPILATPEAIRERFRGEGAVLIGIDEKYITYHNIDSSLVRVLDAEGTELCRRKCGSMRLYRWPLGSR
jgi:hypothetical protein